MGGSLSHSEIVPVIWRSTDRGQTWGTVSRGGWGAGTSIIQIEFISKNIVYALSDRCLGQALFYKSDDAGATWSGPSGVELYHNFRPEDLGTTIYPLTKPMHFLLKK